MRNLSTRKRTPNDDILSVRRLDSSVIDKHTITVPEKASDPIIVWGDSVKRDLSILDEKTLKKCMKWPKSTTSRCHNCAYTFTGVPVPLPIHKDTLRNVYYCSGSFCSWQCAKSFNLRETSPAGRGNRNMYISILCYRLWVKLLNENDIEIKNNMKTYCSYRLEPAKSRSTLIEFGGDLTIEEYRKGFCGVLPPIEDIRKTSPLLNLRKIALVPFINTISSDNKTEEPVKKVDGEKGSFFRGTQRIETNRVAEFNNSFCDRLKKAKEDPTLMTRKKKRDDSNTLMSSMGIEIKKRSKM